MTVGALIAAEMWIRHKDYRAPAAFILMCVLMYTTKETALLTWAAWVAASVLLLVNPKNKTHLLKMNWKSVGIGIAVGILLYAMLFTVAFYDPGAFVDSLLGPLRWAERAREYHIRPVHYFPLLLLFREIPLLIGGIGLAFLISKRGKWTPRLQFFALWTVLITLAYSSISYKTPWCIPNLILPLSLFVAFAFDALWKKTKDGARHNRILAILAVILFSVGTTDTLLSSIVHPDRVRPYDYAYLQSDHSLRRFIKTLEDLNTLHPGEKPMELQRIGNTDELLYVLSKPYMWYDSFDTFRPGLPVYINYMHDDRETLQVLKQSGKNYIRSTYTYMRDWGTLVDLFVEENLWNRYLIEVANESVLPGENPLYDYRD